MIAVISQQENVFRRTSAVPPEASLRNPSRHFPALSTRLRCPTAHNSLHDRLIISNIVFKSFFSCVLFCLFS